MCIWVCVCVICVLASAIIDIIEKVNLCVLARTPRHLDGKDTNVFSAMLFLLTHPLAMNTHTHIMVAVVIIQRRDHVKPNRKQFDLTGSNGATARVRQTCEKRVHDDDDDAHTSDWQGLIRIRKYYTWNCVARLTAHSLLLTKLARVCALSINRQAHITNSAST